MEIAAKHLSIGKDERDHVRKWVLNSALSDFKGGLASHFVSNLLCQQGNATFHVVRGHFPNRTAFET